MIFNSIFLGLVYWMTGLPYELFRFALFTLVGFIVSFVAEGMGLAIGATFSITVSKNLKKKKQNKIFITLCSTINLLDFASYLPNNFFLCFCIIKKFCIKQKKKKD